MKPLLELQDLTVDFELRGGVLRRLMGRRPVTLRSVDRVSLSITQGESVALVGESGSGKTTLARAIVGLVEPTDGLISLDGQPITSNRPRSMRRRAQMVFQDPTGSLNPAMTIERTLLEPMLAHRSDGSQTLARQRCRELLEMVELPSSLLRVRPRQLSGGQKQRVAIARALAVDPDLLIADEPVSALDVSVQAAIINLLRRLQRELRLTLLFISHDLAVVRQVCDRIVVMYLGAVIEEGPADDVLNEPQHPYTRALLAAVPRLEVTRRETATDLRGETPSPLAIPSGCRFHPRCPIVDPALCPSVVPPVHARGDHSASCHFAWGASPALRRAEESGG